MKKKEDAVGGNLVLFSPNIREAIELRRVMRIDDFPDGDLVCELYFGSVVIVGTCLKCVVIKKVNAISFLTEVRNALRTQRNERIVCPYQFYDVQLSISNGVAAFVSSTSNGADCVELDVMHALRFSEAALYDAVCITEMIFPEISQRADFAAIKVASMSRS